jgi:hypothetical protein
MLRLTAAQLTLSVLLGACGGQTTERGPDAGEGVNVDDADRGSDVATCAQLSKQAANALAPALQAASAPLGCTTDSDCTVVPSIATDCTSGCSGPVTTQSGASTLQTAIDQVNASICVAYKQEGCPPPLPPPCAPGPLGAGCVAGKCEDLPMAAWVSFQIEKAPGATGFSLPPTCMQGTTCSLWSVTPDARVAVTDGRGTHQATLSSPDFATVDSIMRSIDFRQRTQTGFQCDPSPGGQVISLTQTRGLELGQDVTGCVLVGPAGNGPQKLYDILARY